MIQRPRQTRGGKIEGEEEKKNLTGREKLPFDKHSAGHVAETLSKERFLGAI